MIIPSKITEKLELFDKISNVGSPEFVAIRKQALELQVKASQNLYKWSFAIITLSSAIFGVSASTFLKSDLIQLKPIFMVALLLLTFNVIQGVWILKNRVERDINGMAEEQGFLNDLIYGGTQKARQKIVDSGGDDGEFWKIVEDFKNNQKEKLRAKEQLHKSKKNKKDYTMDLLLYPFLAGVITLVISVIPWSILCAY